MTSTNVVTGAGSQVSVHVGGGNTGVAGHWIGEATAGQVITGGVVSESQGAVPLADAAMAKMTHKARNADKGRWFLQETVESVGELRFMMLPAFISKAVVSDQCECLHGKPSSLLLASVTRIL